ncbi:MAG: hypothetical protein AAF724_17835 [Pseudomonadota bacterium]
MHFSIRPILALISAFALSTCASVNPAGLIAASRIDPLNTPPSDIAVAVGVPRTLRLVDGDAVFKIAFRAEGGEAPVVVDETVPLELRPLRGGMPKPNSTDEMIYSATFSAEGAERIAAAQQKIRSLRATGIDGKGSITISVTGGCFTQSLPDPLLVSTWLRTAPDEDYVQLTRQVDVLRSLDESSAAMLREEVARCG